MPTGLYFVLKYSSFTFIAHLAYSETRLKRQNLFGPLDDVITGFDCTSAQMLITTLGTFADDTAMFTTHEDPTIASLNLQEHLHIIEKWL